MRPVKVALLTREYPPDVYGGAGVHVAYLARELASLVDLTVHCQGADRPGAVAHQPWDRAGRGQPGAADDLHRPVMTAAVGGADLVHSHTWYANLAGHLAALLYGIPHVMTVHSLEPLRPWKAEQLGGGYALSSPGASGRPWNPRPRHRGIRRHAGRRARRLPGRAAGADPGDPQRHRHHRVRARPRDRRCWQRYGVDPARPSVIFVGRITRQKGVPVLLRAAASLDPGRSWCCAPASRTPRSWPPRSPSW